MHLKTTMRPRKAMRHARSLRQELAGTSPGELTELARERARHGREQAMARVGEWVVHTPLADELGIQKRRRWPMLAGVALGTAAGAAIGMMMARSRVGAPLPSWDDPERVAPPLGEGQVDMPDRGGLPGDVDQTVRV